MNKYVRFAIALLGTSTCIALATFPQKEKIIPCEVSADRMFNGEEFISVNNFLNSGLGVTFQFTYEVPSKDTQLTCCFMGGAGGWTRLTNHFKILFKKDGAIETPVGHIFNIDGKLIFQMMFSELKDYLNTGFGEEADGSETLNGFYLPNSEISIEISDVQLITTGMNAYPIAEVRQDNIPGLSFKAYLPEVNENAKYGMCIVPSSYLKDVNNNYREVFKQRNTGYLDLECLPTKLSESDPIYKSFGKGYCLKASIINIMEENYKVPFVAVPYEIVGDKVTYANLISGTKTNYYNECLKLKNSDGFVNLSGDVKNEVNKVIFKSENHATKVKLDQISAYFPRNTEKIFKEDPLPETLRTTNVMYAAKGESERGQLVINVPSDFNQKYFVSIDPFVNISDSNSKISSDNFIIEQQLYQNVKTNWSVGHQQPKGWYPDGTRIYDLPLGYVPDALLPFDVTYDANENLLTGQNGKNNAVSYTINVPRNAKEGVYTSKIVVSINGKGTLALPIELNVFDFELPLENKNKQVIRVHTEETKALYGTSSYESLYHQSAYNLLRDRNISGGQVPATYWSTEDTAGFVKKVKEIAQDPKVGAYLLPNQYEEIYMNIKVKVNNSKTETISMNGLPIYRAKDTTYVSDRSTLILPGIKTTLKLLIENSTAELDLLKKAVYYFPQADEPGSKTEKHLQNILCENVIKRCIDELLLENIFVGKENIKNSLKNIPYIITSYPRGYLTGVDIVSISYDINYENACNICYCDSAESIIYRHMTCYCPTYESYQDGISSDMGNSYLKNVKDNPEFHNWWYSCIQPITPYPSYFINANLIQKRANTWCQYLLGINGELYYMCNRTQEYHNEVSTPCTEEEILSGCATYEGTYGDGNLIYPVHNIYGKYDPNLYWLSSLRIDNLSESIDDYNYICFADEMIKSKLSSTEQTTYHDKLFGLLDDVTDGPAKNTTDHEFFFNKRIALGELVSELANK